MDFFPPVEWSIRIGVVVAVCGIVVGILRDVTITVLGGYVVVCMRLLVKVVGWGGCVRRSVIRIQGVFGLGVGVPWIVPCWVS